MKKIGLACLLMIIGFISIDTAFADDHNDLNDEVSTSTFNYALSEHLGGVAVISKVEWCLSKKVYENFAYAMQALSVNSMKELVRRKSILIIFNLQYLNVNLTFTCPAEFTSSMKSIDQRGTLKRVDELMLAKKFGDCRIKRNDQSVDELAVGNLLGISSNELLLRLTAPIPLN